MTITEERFAELDVFINKCVDWYNKQTERIRTELGEDVDEDTLYKKFNEKEDKIIENMKKLLDKNTDELEYVLLEFIERTGGDVSSDEEDDDDYDSEDDSDYVGEDEDDEDDEIELEDEDEDENEADLRSFDVNKFKEKGKINFEKAEEELKSQIEIKRQQRTTRFKEKFMS